MFMNIGPNLGPIYNEHNVINMYILGQALVQSSTCQCYLGLLVQGLGQNYITNIFHSIYMYYYFKDLSSLSHLSFKKNLIKITELVHLYKIQEFLLFFI